MKLSTSLWVGLSVLGLGACGGGGNSADPLLIPGGGATGGSIDGVLYVHVIDGFTQTPVANARVQLGDREVTAPVVIMTDATGLATFEDVSGPQMVTITASGYRTGTVIGLDAVNFTSELEASTAPAAASGHLTGTILGWDDLPAPAADHLTAGFVVFSQTIDFDDPANAVQQPGVEPAPNVCFRTPGVAPPCAWELETRVGPQAIAAVIADIDGMGTPAEADNIVTVTGLGIRRGLDVASGQTLGAQDLTILPADGFEDMTIGFEAAPSGLDEVGAFAILRLGDEGQLPLSFTAASPEAAIVGVPALTGELASASYDVFASARSETAQTTIIHPDAQPGTVAVGPWLATPANPTASGGTYTFQAVPGASVHALEISDASGELWSISILDDTTSFTLPMLATDPLPPGELALRVSAVEVEGFDPSDFRVDDVRDALRRTSENRTTFTH